MGVKMDWEENILLHYRNQTPRKQYTEDFIDTFYRFAEHEILLASNYCNKFEISEKSDKATIFL